MGSGSSTVNQLEVKAEENIEIESKKTQNNINYFAETFLINLLKNSEVFCVTKIFTVSDFIDFCSMINTSNYSESLINKLLYYYNSNSYNMCNINEYVKININSDFEIGKMTKNIIFSIRNLMLEKKEIILKNVNTIDIFVKNYNENQNTEKITKLNELLRIEKTKIDNAKFDDISTICKNISNLSENLKPFENNIIKFDSKIEYKKQLKIQFTNISLFLEYTNHLFSENQMIYSSPIEITN